MLFVYLAVALVFGGAGLRANSLPLNAPTFAASADVQDVIEPNCPLFEVECNESVHSFNDPLKFTVRFHRSDPQVKPTYRWKVSGGQIVRGQDTAVITVDAKRTKLRTIRARVRVGGYSRDCPLVASCEVKIEYLVRRARITKPCR
jgi:hypothetical protein